MTPCKTLALLLMAVTVAVSCAHARVKPSQPGPTPEERLQNAMAALDSGQYAPATKQLLDLARDYSNGAVGRAALLGAAAAQLDPRNPDRQLDQGANLLASYLRASPPGDWTEPVAASLYLLAQEAGASAERVEQAQADAARARAEARRVPRLPGAPLTARLEDVQKDLDRMAARVKELETNNQDLRKQLADTLQELQRVRRTLRP